IVMNRSSPESDKRKRGLREFLRSYWCRTAYAVRSLFFSSQGCYDATEPTSRENSSNQPLSTSKPDYDIGDALSVSGSFIRRWEQISAHPGEKADSSTFRVASYNVLCQNEFEANPALYPHLENSSPFREWSHRWNLLVNEISALDADILGLQEVPKKHFVEFFKPLLESLGYSLLFLEKTGESHNHGLIIALRKESFEIDSNESIEFFQGDDPVLDRGNVGQIARVVCRRSKSSLLLAHIHLLFDPSRGDTKLAQIAYLLSRIHKYRKDDEPIICLGDFNFEPASKLYDYITTGILNASTFSIKHGSGQTPVDSTLAPPSDFIYELPRETFVHTMMDRKGEIQNDLFDLLHSLNTTLPNQLTHRLKLASVHAESLTVSTHHVQMSSPDFIFFDSGNNDGSNLRLLRRLALPTNEDLREVERWPNEHLPSDHICLLAEFGLTRV
ncbi:hypothetical protein PENTCL1PPCAC_28835, partial [Pristionchus entomophagus]